MIVPLVKFRHLNHPIPIFPNTWNHTELHIHNTRVELQRSQIPLALAWATTIHKSQGQTLDYAVVDISRTFTEGQAYVGVSRVRRKEDMQVVLPWDDRLERAFRADPWVIQFYRDVGEEARVIFGDEEEEELDEF